MLGYLAAFLVTFFVFALIGVVILVAYAFYLGQQQRQSSSQLPALDVELFDYCKAIVIISDTYPSVPVPPPQTYTQETAIPLISMLNWIGQSFCNYSSPPAVPAEFTNSLQLSAGGNIYCVLYYNTTKAVALFPGLTSWAALESDLTPATAIGAAAGNVNAQLLSIYMTYCREQILNIFTGKTDIIIAGHSLGGATSTICAADIFTNSAITATTKTHYSFASPRVGDSDFANFYNANVGGIRINNVQDIIPQLPLANSPYIHVGQDFPFEYTFTGFIQNHMAAYLLAVPSCPVPGLAQCN